MNTRHIYRLAAVVIMSCMTATLSAQETVTHKKDSVTHAQPFDTPSGIATMQKAETATAVTAVAQKPVDNAAEATAPSVTAIPALPADDAQPLMPVLSPYTPGFWWLHKGMNVQVNLGAAIGFGKHNPYRNGAFFTDVSAIYLADTSVPKLSLAIGGGLSHTRISGDSYVNATVMAMAAYRLTERLTALAMVEYTTPSLGNKQFIPNPYIYGCRPYGAYSYGHRFGPLNPAYNPYFDGRLTPGMSFTGGINYKVTENFHIGISASYNVIQDVY